MKTADPSRAFHAFCVGNAKSGTYSLTGVFEANFRSSHEPERSELLAFVLSEAAGSVTADRAVEFIRERDQRLCLEFDSSWVNFFIVGHLVGTFPDAKFVLLIPQLLNLAQAELQGRPNQTETLCSETGSF